MIQLIKEEGCDQMGSVLELCCICREPTPFWTNLSDRKPGQQVACCEKCAKLANPEHIPSKEVWCARERILRTRENAMPARTVRRVLI